MPIVSIVVPFFGFNQIYTKDPKKITPKKDYNGDYRQGFPVSGSRPDFLSPPSEALLLLQKEAHQSAEAVFGRFLGFRMV